MNRERARHERRVGAGLAYLSMLLGIMACYEAYTVITHEWPTELAVFCTWVIVVGAGSWAIIVALSVLALL